MTALRSNGQFDGSARSCDIPGSVGSGIDLKVCVIVPFYNESSTIDVVADRLESSFHHQHREIIYVDDGSSDGSSRKLSDETRAKSLVITKPLNEGKTRAVLDALGHVRSGWVIVHDADLEYDPADIEKLRHVAIRSGGVVYGYRSFDCRTHQRWLHNIGVRVIDGFIWLLHGKLLWDHATCYKLMPTEVLRSLDLQSIGFEGCVEITAKLMRLGVPIHQVPISYMPRTAAEGKKLNWRYGLTALATAWRWRQWQPSGEQLAVARRAAAGHSCLPVAK